MVEIPITVRYDIGGTLAKESSEAWIWRAGGADLNLNLNLRAR